ncbi:MAG: hypothetical protein ACI88A_003180 [Paraglaciecola sp.]|jgi:uncharacterized protein YndB with AHSA1/START domain
MKILKKIFLVVAGLLLLLLIVGFLLPSEFKVQRSISIKAPASEVYKHVVNLRKWKTWGVWFKRDPTMLITYSGAEGDVGMTSKWVSEQEGSGEMVIIALEPNQRFIYSLYFPEMDMGSTGEFIFKESNGQTEVIWLDYGDLGSNPINHYFSLFMDQMIGPDFEVGLENLKTLAEFTHNN